MRCSSHHHPKHVVFTHSFLVSVFILIFIREIQTGPLISTNKTSTENTVSPSSDLVASQLLQAAKSAPKRPLQPNDTAAQVELPQTESSKTESVPPATHNPITSIHETKPDVSSTKYFTASFEEVGTIIDHALQTAVTDGADVVTYYHSPSDITTDPTVSERNELLLTSSAPLSLHNEDTNITTNKSHLDTASNISISQATLGLTFRESPTSSPIVIETPSLVTHSSKEFVLGNPTDRNATIKTVLRTGVVSSVSVASQPDDQNVTSTHPLKDIDATGGIPTSHEKLNSSQDFRTSSESPVVLVTPSTVFVLVPPTESNSESTSVSPTVATIVSASREILHNNVSVSHRPSLGTSTPSALFVAETALNQSNVSVNISSSSSAKNVTGSSITRSSNKTTQKPSVADSILKSKPNNFTSTALPSTNSSGFQNTTKKASSPETPSISSVHVSDLEELAATEHVQTSQETWTAAPTLLIAATTLLPTKELSGMIETPTTNLISSDPTVLNIHHAEDPLGVGAIIGIILGVLGLVILVGGVCGFLIYHRRLKPLSEVKYPTDNCGYVDDSLRVSYVNNHIELPKESSEEMFSLDNDSFLNSLEAMTLQNYWAEDAKNTKV